MAKDQIKYQTGFSSGALLYKEADAVITRIQDYESFIKGDSKIDYRWVPVNSESSQKRYAQELEKRLRIIEVNVISFYKHLSENDKRILLFYAACKYYPLIADFMIEVVLNKWLHLDKELDVDDFQNFLHRKMDNHPELEAITEKTRSKLSQVMMKMLKELGMLHKGKLIKIEYDMQVFNPIIKNEDGWFLDVMLLNEIDKKEILNNI